MPPRRKISDLESGVRKAIREAPDCPPWLAAHALKLVAEIESADEDAPLAARVSAGKLLRDTMADIAAAAPAEEQSDGLDELAKRRAKRIG